MAMELLAKHRTVTTEERYAANAVKHDCLTSISNDTDNMVWNSCNSKYSEKPFKDKCIAMDTYTTL